MTVGDGWRWLVTVGDGVVVTLSSVVVVAWLSVAVFVVVVVVKM